MKNVLIDQNCKWLASEDSKYLLKDYAEIFVVGEHLKQREYDENLATFCMNNSCELLTADNRAYVHFFSDERIKNIQISEFVYEHKADRPIYLVKIIE
ncbi:hypothetical protein NsoK4_03595 [Nitrosopumilus sp. K4]|uniref:hypothetical protein n=1 Tax=Nitrosopumilus sp. K4 TaxID=2795383 RepID=UPI001BAC87D1|nr:hypothetical protein [Nitrosopumilus sp. K4]QUC65339.1 hypothetical protein NsoK4_03595 [Nitrosopumilus sp. K4]